jgi:hypothetical protein
MFIIQSSKVSFNETIAVYQMQHIACVVPMFCINLACFGVRASSGGKHNTSELECHIYLHILLVALAVDVIEIFMWVCIIRI